MTQYSTLGAASHQLEKAISLFLEGDHLCSVTLCGAAEELLGKLSKQAGHDVAVEYIAAYHAADFSATGEDMTRTEIISSLNRARNGAKHYTPGCDVLPIDWADSFTLLMRAIPMARELGIRTSSHDQFEEWQKSNKRMIDEYMS